MGELVELDLTAMAHGGLSVGRSSGRVVFVPFAVPGEKVRAEIVEVHDRWARAHLSELLVPSPYRVDPPCPYFGPGRCGGCHFQHIAYGAQAEFKRQVVADQLARVGGLRSVPVRDIVAAEDPWRYRNHVTLTPLRPPPPALGSEAPLLGGGSAEEDRVRPALGFLSADSHAVYPVEACLIADPLIDETWSALDLDWPQLRRLSLRCGSATGDRMAIFELDRYEDFDIEVDLPVSCAILLPDGEVVVLMGESQLVESVAGREYRISAGSFFQVNTAGAEALVSVVRDLLEPEPHHSLLDLYCGVGLFSLALGGDVGRVTGIESSFSSASDFRYNAAGLDHVSLVEDAVESALPKMEGPIDLMVLDPPRAGAGRQVIGEIARLRPPRIAYVSCDPATLARDARSLTEEGFALVAVQPVDLFPQTFHVESVALFAR